jgi:hypothetical protein
MYVGHLVSFSGLANGGQKQRTEEPKAYGIIFVFDKSESEQKLTHLSCGIRFPEDGFDGFHGRGNSA